MIFERLFEVELYVQFYFFGIWAIKYASYENLNGMWLSLCSLFACHLNVQSVSVQYIFVKSISNERLV